MKPAWTFTALGFLAGTLFGALAVGRLGGLDLAQPEAPVESTVVEAVPAAEPVGLTPDAVARAVKLVPEPAPSEPAPALVASTPSEDPSSADPRIDAILAAWQDAEARLSDLQARLVQVEQTLAGRIANTGGERESDRPVPPSTPDDRRKALVAAGVDLGLADDIIWREGRLELDRLTLRDQAVREGWIGTDRYREEVSRLTGEPKSLREEIGDDAYDRYLYLTGEDNRVRVSAVIPGSAAEAAGLQPGDLIESYAGERPFGYVELRDITTAGEAGELIAVRVRRGGGTVETWVPRGPLGIRMEATRAEPGP